MSEEEWFIDNEDDIEDFKRSKIMTADQLALDDDDDGYEGTAATAAATATSTAAAAVGQLVPFEITPLSDSNAVRPEYALVAMWTLMYAQVTQGIAVPSVLTLGGGAGGGGGNDSVKFDF
jgi:hypothetical protein